MQDKKVVYSDIYDVDIGTHVFPTEKYKLLRKKLIKQKVLSADDFEFPESAKDEDILLVHSKNYLDKLKTGCLNREEIFRLEIPYSKELLSASYICVDGTIRAALNAFEKMVGIHLGGGFHHAFSDHGEGFCVFNDVAIAVRKMIKTGRIKKAMVIDCDLHQGNGTADIFRNDKNVFTFSIHQQNNYPFYKPESDLDIGLDDRASDEEYLEKLKKSVNDIVPAFGPELIMYVAGADPYERDQIGNLALSIDGLKKRDEFLFDSARRFKVPVAVVLAGGYASDVYDTVAIHFNTVKTALDYQKAVRD